MERFMGRSDPLAIFEQPEHKEKLTSGLLMMMNICGISYSALVVGMTFLTSLMMTLPVVHVEWSEYWLRVGLLLYLLFGIVSNFVLVNRKRGYVYGSDCLPNSSWRRCQDCEMDTPPNSHHCPLCKHCVMRRDHHCFFTASCVGHENQRYFIMFCFYCGTGSLYCLYLMHQYIDVVFLQTEVVDRVHYFLPLLAVEVILGWRTFHLFWCVMIAYLCGISALGSYGIFFWQLLLVSLGTSTFQYSQSKWSKINIIHNFRAVFGPWWLCNFIMPMPWLRTPEDGLSGIAAKCI